VNKVSVYIKIIKIISKTSENLLMHVLYKLWLDFVESFSKFKVYNCITTTLQTRKLYTYFLTQILYMHSFENVVILS